MQATTTRKGRKRPSNLREQVDQKTVDIYKYQSWATPRDADSAGGPRTLNEKGQRISVSDPTKTYGANLSDQVRHWPTPATRDYKGGQNIETCKAKNRNPLTNNLADAVRATTDSKALNPDWVEKLMGVPTGWTALDGDSNEWQHDWSGDWEGNTPRTTDIKKDRIDRIRMTGNGVVPATAAKAWTVLSARLNKGE